MPHVVLEGAVTIDDAVRVLGPFLEREGSLIVKAERVYREKDARAVLIEIVVVEGNHTQRFFIQIGQRPSGVTVRLEPLTDPEKTAGVRRALAHVAHRIRSATGAAYGPTNIEGDLIR